MGDNDPATLALTRDAMLANYMDETFALRERVMRLTLTPAERDAITAAEIALRGLGFPLATQDAATLRDLLSRTAE
jgi:hypothetical protein